MQVKRFSVFLILCLLMASVLIAGPAFHAEADMSEPEGRVVRLSVEGMDESAVRYDLFKKGADENDWTFVLSYADLKDDMIQNISNNTPTCFRLVAFDANENVMWETKSSEVVTQAMWFNTKRITRFIAMLLASGLILYYIRQARQMKKIYLRPIAGLKAFEEAVGRATEMGKSVLYVPGIMDLDQVETIAGVIILGHVAKMTARYESDLNVPVSRSLVMEAARELVHESYMSEGRPDLFNSDMVHYYTDDQFAFAAAVDGIMLREKPAAVFLQGKFYAESLILAETGNSIGAIQIAGTGSPSQIPFFVTACDYTLIGEEFFAASAYLGQDPKLLGSIKGQDIFKAVIMGAIVVGVLLESFGLHFFKAIFKL